MIHVTFVYLAVGEYDMVLPEYHAIRVQREKKKREEKIAKKALKNIHGMIWDKINESGQICMMN